MKTIPPPRGCGIYRLVHRPSGECYVGSTTNFYMRYILHRSNLRRKDVHPKARKARLFQRFHPFREQDFVFEILEICPPSVLDVREIAWMNKLAPVLNTSRYANRAPNGIKYHVPANLPHIVLKVPADRKPGPKAKK